MATIPIHFFCDNNFFQHQVIYILTSVLFQKTQVQKLNDIYEDMKRNVYNMSGPWHPKLYSLPANSLQNVSPAKISSPNGIYAGHDLPVWLNDPYKADVRIMIVSQDPRRSDAEMKSAGLNQQRGIAVSSPFGLHDPYWRSKPDSLIYDVVANLIGGYEMEGIELSVYFTDIYKLHGVDSIKSVPKITSNDTNNSYIYCDIFKQELDLFQPDIIVLLGKEAQNAKKCCTSGSYSSNPNLPIIIELPHPSRQANGAWKKRLEKSTGQQVSNETLTERKRLEESTGQQESNETLTERKKHNIYDTLKKAIDQVIKIKGIIKT